MQGVQVPWNALTLGPNATSNWGPIPHPMIKRIGYVDQKPTAMPCGRQALCGGYALCVLQYREEGVPIHLQVPGRASRSQGALTRP